MGLQHSISPIVTNGLIMNLDAGNSASVRSGQNLLRNSEDFTASTWTKNPGLLITSTNEVDPNGNRTANILSSIVTTGVDAYRVMYADYVAQPSYTFVNTSYTFSFYIKDISLVKNNIGVVIYNLQYQGTTRSVYTNYRKNTNDFSGVGVEGGWTSGGTTVTSVGNGWYRVSLTANTTASTYTTIRCEIWIGGYSGSLPGESLGSFAIWGAQLEASLSPRTYIKTTGSIIETIWNDISGNNNHAYNTSISGYGGNVTYNSSGFFDFSMNSPDSNGAGQGAYNGNGFIMAANNNVVPLTGSFTLNAVVRRNLTVKGGGDRETIFSNGQGADGWRFGIYTGQGNALYYLISGANGVGYQEGSLGTIDAIANNTWHMVTIVYDRAAQLGSYSIVGYVDSVLSGSVPITSGASGNVPYSFNALTPGIGYAGCCDVFAGQIAIVQAYNRALTASEVSQNFQSIRRRFGI